MNRRYERHIIKTVLDFRRRLHGAAFGALHEADRCGSIGFMESVKVGKHIADRTSSIDGFIGGNRRCLKSQDPAVPCVAFETTRYAMLSDDGV